MYGGLMILCQAAHLIHLFLRINHFPFSLIWSFLFLRLFLFPSFLFLHLFYFCIFFRHHFFQLLYGATQTDLDGLSSFASHSGSLISLSYSMAVFSAKSFGLSLCNFSLWSNSRLNTKLVRVR